MNHAFREGSGELAISDNTKQLFERVSELKGVSGEGSGSYNVQFKKKAAPKPLEENLFDACAEAKILTSQVSMHIARESIARLYHQLDLIHDPSEWEEGEEPVSAESFKTFLRWMLFTSPEKGPGLGLSPQGFLVGMWMTGKDRLALEFLPGDRAKWIISKASDDGVDRSTGETRILRLPSFLAPFDIDQFFGK